MNIPIIVGANGKPMGTVNLQVAQPLDPEALVCLVAAALAGSIEYPQPADAVPDALDLVADVVVAVGTGSLARRIKARQLALATSKSADG